ncbi:MAG: acyl-CoA synthetase, partial [Acidimicrobiales bacterium]
SQPDLGTKWSPRFVRLLRALPVTGAAKVDKAPLRADAWEVADPVWWRPRPQGDFLPLTPSEVAGLRARFEAAGRGHLAPGGPGA